MVLDLMATINANDLRISAAGGYVTACSPRPGAATGTRTIALANQDGQLNPGDSIVVTYRDCWIDDATDDIDLLWNGTITMSGYIENKSPFSTGFEEIRFNGLAEYETITSAGTVTVEPLALVTNGTMTLFVTPCAAGGPGAIERRAPAPAPPLSSRDVRTSRAPSRCRSGRIAARRAPSFKNFRPIAACLAQRHGRECRRDDNAYV
jgi:hypothetical protein